MEKEVGVTKIEDFIGNKQAVDFFNFCLENSFPAQAFGVYGPRHVGKKHLIRSLAKVLKCVPGVSYFNITPEEGKRDIAIEQIRDWQKLMRLSSTNGGYMIGVIEKGEALNSASANALLKIIEEPPKNVLIFICANSANSLIPTIQSRLLPINLKVTNSTLLKNELSNLKIPENNLKKIVELAVGLPGLAIKLNDNKEFFDLWLGQVNEIEKIINGSVDKRLIWLQSIFESKKAGEDFDPIQLLSKMAVLIGKKAEENPGKFAHALAWLAEAPKLIKGNVNQRLLFEKIILSI